MGNVLDLFDQTAFDLGRATGVTTLLQCVWVYDRPVDLRGLRQFHSHLQRGRLTRCIERSPLPFGRHRWTSPDRSSDIEVVATRRPRQHLDTWLAEHAATPLDVEHGPGWHLAVLPFTDGGAGVSLLISHCLTDGVGLCEALADAARGRDDPVGWPPSRSRGRWQALREDAGQTARDTRAIARALSTAPRSGRGGRPGAGTDPSTSAPAGADQTITVPIATLFVDTDDWDTRAQSLGGTSNTLLAGLAARLAHRAGRVAVDGSVAVAIPVNERAAGDTRANATTDIDVTVDPARATTDLREVRTAIKQALIGHRTVSDERRALLHVVPLLPQRLLRRVGVGSGNTSYVVSSNLGVVDPAAARPDGTDADFFTMRLLPVGLTKARMQRSGGLHVLVSGKALGQVFLSLAAYLPGRSNSNVAVQQDLLDALADFALTHTHRWSPPDRPRADECTVAELDLTGEID